MKAATPLHQKLYQVQVLINDRPAMVGPAMSDPTGLYDFAAAINVNVAKGREKTWREAKVVELSTMRS